MSAREPEQVRPGIWALPMSMPGPLQRTYIYALEVGGSVLLVDAGWGGEGDLELLGTHLGVIGCALEDISGVVLTHGHPDHYGLVDSIRAKSGAWIALHPQDARNSESLRDAARLGNWLFDLGVDAEDAQATLAVLNAWKAPELSPDRTLVDASVLVVGNRRLEVIHTPGHSPGHVCLVDSDNRVVFTGDHVLSWTTPNVSVRVGDDGSPLDDYLASLRRMLPFEDFLALPGHEERVLVAARAREILTHHSEQLDYARSIMRAGEETVAGIAARMPWTRPWEALGLMDRFLAVGETLAHLHVLERRGEAERRAVSPQRWRVTERAA